MGNTKFEVPKANRARGVYPHETRAFIAAKKKAIAEGKGEDEIRNPLHAGRPKGASDGRSAAIKDLIRQAIDEKGGVKVFSEFLERYPVEFMQHLVKPMLPRNVDVGGVLGTPVTLAEMVKMQAQLKNNVAKVALELEEFEDEQESDSD